MSTSSHSLSLVVRSIASCTVYTQYHSNIDIHCTCERPAYLIAVSSRRQLNDIRLCRDVEQHLPTVHATDDHVIRSDDVTMT